MKNSILVLVVLFAFCPTAMAIEIAISTQANWWGQAAADREMQEIADNVTAASVEQFGVDEQDALASWVADHTGDGLPDLLILCGAFPDTIYTPGNTQADDSLAELFLDDGNTIINTGDYMFYVVNGAGTNAAGGLQTMMDIGGITMWDDDTAVTVTVDGQEVAPSLLDYASDRPFHLDELEGDWEPELILAQNAAGTRADPVIVVNTDTGGRLGIFYQTASQDDDPRGEVISEWINNWYLTIAGGGGNPLARRPDPEDGGLLEQTWGTLSWRAGHYAVSHDLYMGENFDDVNSGAADTFVGNLPTAQQIVGFIGFPLPDGLVPGTTYYWRVDEVNDANAASPWKGPVWSFSIPPRTSYGPVPADGAKFIETDSPALSWTGGFNVRLHTVYFGASFDEVDAAAGNPPQAGLTFTAPGPLEPETTYYWRVDEFDDLATTHKGQIWSFTTAREGGGVKGQYFHWNDPTFVGGGGNPGPGQAFGTLVLTRTDPRIDFTFSDSPDAAVNIDMFSARWTGEVEAGFTETYTFYTRSDDGARLWVDGRQIVDQWVDQGATEASGEIDLEAGKKYSLVMEYYENGGGAVAELRWSSPSTPKDFVPQAALSFLVHANTPTPINGTEGVNLTSQLTWKQGDFASSHEVYFGTDADAVANATKASPEYKGSKALGDEVLDPGPLAFDATYFWRIDEVNATNPDSPWVGNVWTFWTGDFVVIEDFEAYNDINEGEQGSNRIYLTWIDGFGTTTNGGVAGNLDAPFMSAGRVGGQAMPVGYDNAGKTSEVTRSSGLVPDWTANGVTKLSLWFRGAGGNAADRMYVALGNAVVYHSDDAATQDAGWNEWVIDLQEFADQGANLSNVTSMTLGIGTRNAPVATGGAGTVEFDDIRLVQ